MANSQRNAESDSTDLQADRIRFLSEDLKETGDHLRDTDRKVSFALQLYGGAIVLLGSVGVGYIQSREGVSKGIDPTLVLIILSLLSLFTYWVLHYSFRGRETKSLYIYRMNFLRRHIHYYLQTGHRDLAGFWTGASPPKDVGVDDLYPLGIGVVLVMLVASTAFAGSMFLLEPTTLGVYFLGCLVAFVAGMLTFFLVRGQYRITQDNIEEHSKKYESSVPGAEIPTESADLRQT